MALLGIGLSGLFTLASVPQADLGRLMRLDL